MTGQQEYDRNMTGRQDDRQDDRQRILDEYMIDLPRVLCLSYSCLSPCHPVILLSCHPVIVAER
jgi:hypothetical protein